MLPSFQHFAMDVSGMQLQAGGSPSTAASALMDADEKEIICDVV